MYSTSTVNAQVFSMALCHYFFGEMCRVRLIFFFKRPAKPVVTTVKYFFALACYLSHLAPRFGLCSLNIPLVYVYMHIHIHIRALCHLYSVWWSAVSELHKVTTFRCTNVGLSIPPSLGWWTSELECSTAVETIFHVSFSRKSASDFAPQSAQRSNAQHLPQALCRTVSQEVPRQCELCGKWFTQKGSLNRHLYGVHMGKRYACAWCNKTYSQQDSLHRHEKLHMKDSDRR